MAFPWLEFLGLMLAWSIGAVIPGADFAMVLRQSVTHGRPAALWTSAGIAVAVLVHGSYTLLGLGLIISQSLLLFDMVKYAGVAYLIWIAVGALRAPAPQPPELQPATAGASAVAAFGLGFLTNLLNPKAVLFFVALFTTLVAASTAMETRVFYIAVMSATLFCWFALVSIFFTMPAVRGAFFRLGRWFNVITGLTFIALAVRVAVARPQ